MIHAVLRSERTDGLMLEEEIRRRAAYDTDERVIIVGLYTREDLLHFLEQDGRVDIICADVAVFRGIEQAERLRRKYPQAAMILVADVEMSPVTYMRPTILAAALLLKPLTEASVRRAVEEIFRHFIQEVSEDEMFVLKTREDKQRIPWPDILYFEARAKKVYVCTADQEYGFYDTIDHLETLFSDRFIRCHRSYLVNRDAIEKIKLSHNCILLRGDVELPLSRSYKGLIKELM